VTVAQRFDRTERLVHWVGGVLLLTTLATGLVLYVGSLSALVGRRVLVKDLHVWSGLLSPLPFAIGMLGPWRGALRADVRHLARWSDDDVRWLRSLGRRVRAAGKFNAGQKANAVFVAGAVVVQTMTGLIMRWFEPFPLAWRTGATFVHDWTAIALWIVIAGHIVMAFANPVALRGMITGVVPAGGIPATRTSDDRRR
jgi:formate dehydrogenase subunit gamma